MEKTIISIGNVDIPVFEEEFPSHNIISVKVGTSGFQEGEEHRYDCKTYLRISNNACTQMKAVVVEEDEGRAENVQILFEGESELITFMCGLKFALDTLVEQTKGFLPDFDLDKCYANITEFAINKNEIGL